MRRVRGDVVFSVFLPLYVQVSAWDAGFGLQGWFTQAVGDVTNVWLRGERAVIWIHTLAAIPWSLLIVVLGLCQVEPDLEELALLDVAVGSARGCFSPAGDAGDALGVAPGRGDDLWRDDRHRCLSCAHVCRGALFECGVNGRCGGTRVQCLATRGAGGAAAVPAWCAAEILAPSASALRSACPCGSIWESEPAAVVCRGRIDATRRGSSRRQPDLSRGFSVDASGEELVRRWTWERFAQSTLPTEIWPWRWEFQREYKATLLVAVSTATLTLMVAIPLAGRAEEVAQRAGDVALRRGAGAAGAARCAGSDLAP